MHEAKYAPIDETLAMYNTLTYTLTPDVHLAVVSSDSCSIIDLQLIYWYIATYSQLLLYTLWTELRGLWTHSTTTQRSTCMACMCVWGKQQGQVRIEIKVSNFKQPLLGSVKVTEVFEVVQ